MLLCSRHASVSPLGMTDISTRSKQTVDFSCRKTSDIFVEFKSTDAFGDLLHDLRDCYGDLLIDTGVLLLTVHPVKEVHDLISDALSVQLTDSNNNSSDNSTGLL